MDPPEFRVPKKQKVLENTEKIEDDMLLEILILLPVNSLMRFKSVSSYWKSLIQHPYFVSRRRRRSSSVKRLLLELTKIGPARSQPPSVEGITNFSIQLPPRNYYTPWIKFHSNHCNGLVCLVDKKDTRAYLHNVTTGETKPLPSMLLRPGVWPFIPKLYLGFDEATETYKLLHVSFLNHERKKKMKILTLGGDGTDNTFRDIQYDNPIHNNILYDNGIYINGMLYWSCPSGPVDYFDFTKEKFGRVLPPETTIRFKYLNKLQTLMSGNLVMYCDDECYWVYDQAKQVFVKLCSALVLEKPSNNHSVGFLDLERVDDSKDKYVLLAIATLAASSTAASSTMLPILTHISHFLLEHASVFVDNIIPLSCLI